MLTLALGASLVFTPATAAPLPGRWWIIAGALGLTHMLVHFSTPGIGTLLRHLGSVTISILVLDQFTRPCASPRISYFGNLLRTRLLIWVGTISYGLYLIHFPIFYLVFHEAVERGETASLPLVLAAITLVLILAWLAHLLIERPCARLRRRWGSQSPVAVVG
jgi:peptidoglycan/LPS O-acetylase OafA/YrhL